MDTYRFVRFAGGKHAQDWRGGWNENVRKDYKSASQPRHRRSHRHPAHPAERLRFIGRLRDPPTPPNLNPDLFGSYLLHQIGVDGSGTVYTAQVEVVPNGDGTGNFTIARHSAGSAGLSGSFTYTVATDHTFTVDNGSGIDSGILASDNALFVMVDAEFGAADSDSESIVGIALRKDCSSPPTLSGDYRLAQIGVDHNAAIDLIETKLVDINISGIPPGNGNFIVLKDSGGSAGGFGDFTFAIGADCTITVNNGLGDDYGIVSADGSRFVLVDADRGVVDSDNEIVLVVGIQKSTNSGNGHFVGDYWLGEAGVNGALGAGLYTAQIDVTSAGNGSATATGQTHSLTSALGPPLPLTYSVSGTDGTSSVNNGTKTDDGMIDAAGELIFTVDTDPADGTITLNSGVLY